MKTRIFVLYTGGTIGMAPKDPSNPCSPLTPKPLAELLEYAPGFDLDAMVDADRYRSEEARALAQHNRKKSAKESRTPFLEMDNGNVIEIGHGSFEPPVDSADLSPDAWQRMATRIEKVYDQYDGFIILHGTDTMAYTASALSFMFENLGKPVVMTGSQRPISDDRTDAVMNFVNAIHIAGYKAVHLPLIPEVVIVFADRILRGCRARKISVKHRAGFDSPNYPWLGRIGERIVIATQYVLPPPTCGQRLHIHLGWDTRVFHASIFPGFWNPQLKQIFSDPNIQGIVINAYGAGNAPGDQAFLDSIEQAVQDHRLVVNISQCAEGMVDMGRYETGAALLERGVLSGSDMTPEAALTKLMWTLGARSGADRITQMRLSQRGEQTEHLFDLRFGGVAEQDAESRYVNSVSPDGRMDRDRIRRAMLRISALGCPEAEADDSLRIRVFLNMSDADHDAPDPEPRCIMTIAFLHDAQHPVKTHLHDMRRKASSVIGDGDVMLTLIVERRKKGGCEWNPTPVFFRGLCMTVYTEA